MTGVVLRELRASDLPVLNQWRADRELIDQLGSPFRYVGPDVEQRWYEQYLANRASNVRLAVCASDGAMVGVVYLLHIDWISRSCEFAISIGDPGARRQGVGTAATRLALRHAFFDLNLERVYLDVLAGNAPAIRLYRNAGFAEEGVRRRSVFKEGQYLDLLSMAVLKQDFNGLTSHADAPNR